MSELEEKVKKILIKQGWQVISKGWPDLLVYKERKHGYGLKVCAIEVKNYKDNLSLHQKLCHSILKAAGLPVFIVRPQNFDKIKNFYGLCLPIESDKNYLESLIKQLEDQIIEIKKMINDSIVLFDDNGSDGMSIREEESQITEEMIQDVQKRIAMEKSWNTLFPSKLENKK